jgi:phosphonate transport system substrate-binding protein
MKGVLPVHKRTMPLLFVVFSLLLFPFPAPAQEKQELTLWVHPYLPATELVKRFSPLTSYLAAELKQPVRIRIQKSYKSHVDFVGQDQADIAFMGPAPYVLLRKGYGPKPLLVRLEESGVSFFHGVVVVRREAPFRSLADLQGKSFAFGDPDSTMGHVVPRAMLAEAGVPVSRLQRHDFLHSHHDVALAVLGGYFDAGAVKDEVFAEYEKRGLRVLAKSPPVAEHLFVTRATLPPALVERLRALFLAVNSSPRKQEILSSIKATATSFVPVSHQDYDSLEKLMAGADGE